MRRLATVLCSTLALALLPWAPDPAGAAATLTGPLHTSGNQIYDASNQPVRLRGLTRVTLGTRPVTEEEIAHARRWGANIVRVTLSEDRWMQLCPLKSYDSGYPSQVDQVVDWITSRGMVALLELIVNPRFPCDSQAERPQKMAASPGSVVFWKNLAGHYKDNPLVAFELYNEPHDISQEIWLRGGQVSDGLISWRAAGMQELYDAVRGKGAENLVVVSGPGWSSVPPKTPLSGYNIVYAAHVYRCPHQPPPNCTKKQPVGPMGLVELNLPAVNPYDPTPIMDRWTELAATHPVAITEFGWPAENDGTYNANVIAEAEERGWSWIAYAWHGSAMGKFNLLVDAGPGASYEPNPAGVPVKEGLSVEP